MAAKLQGPTDTLDLRRGSSYRLVSDLPLFGFKRIPARELPTANSSSSVTLEEIPTIWLSPRWITCKVLRPRLSVASAVSTGL
eukprot:5689367-Amphidinium_carterae.1